MVLLPAGDVGKNAKTAWLREKVLSGEIRPIDRVAYTFEF